jgi:hypothetical protein
LYNHLVGHVQPLVNETAMRDTMANAAELAKNRHFFEAIRLILRRVDKTSEVAKSWRHQSRRASVLEAVRRHLSKPDFQPGEWMNAYD